MGMECRSAKAMPGQTQRRPRRRGGFAGADVKTRALQAVARAVVRCRRCPRLVAYRERVAREKRRSYRHEKYWGRAVPGFGDPQARLLIIGLAPAAHGANRTGRLFTGDRSGDWLMDGLYRAGFANQPVSRNCNDGLRLRGAYVSAILRCAPPANRPSPVEVARCRRYLVQELEIMQPRLVLVLGRIAHCGYLAACNEMGYELPRPLPRFAHGAVHQMPWGTTLICSYHPSQQNTQTGRLTREMFAAVLASVRRGLAEQLPERC